jgi:hypothetical protein
MDSRRISIEELRYELERYVQERQQAGKAPKTVDLDRRKVIYFLDWLEGRPVR